MGSVKSLAKDTVYYGASSIIGRFINWLLVPLYTNVFSRAEYGVVTYVYAVVAIALVILTYGMETGFFRFANDERSRGSSVVYSTVLTSLAVTSTLFVAIVAIFLSPISQLMECAAHPSFVMMMAVCVALDAFMSIPFSYLRFRHRPVKFAILKLAGIGINIALNLFFILACPWLMVHAPATVDWFYDPGFGVGYIFLSNLVSSACMLPLLREELTGFRWSFSTKIIKEMLRYSWPLLVLGFAGIMNQNLDKILLPHLIPDEAERMSMTGVYGACFKLAVIMVMFLQAFRYAYEPFIFDRARSQGEDKKQTYATVMKWFVAFAMLIFLAVMVYMPLLEHLIGPGYRSGIGIVPIIMMGELFFGICFNLSLWYKLTDRTRWGMWLTLIGLAVVVTLNIALVPRFGYYGSAWASFACYGTMMVLSYFLGQKYFPINYHVGRIALYTGASLLLYGALKLMDFGNIWISMSVGTLMIVFYLWFVLKVEKITLREMLPIDAIRKKLHH